MAFQNQTKLLALLASLSVLSACENPQGAAADATGSTAATGEAGGSLSAQACYTDRFRQPEASLVKKLDLLFITDTSGSMRADRGRIADNIDAFVRTLPSGTDLQIGVMLAHGSLSSRAGRLWRGSSSDPLVLSTASMTMPNLRAALKRSLTKTATDIFSGGGEEGLYSLQRVLTDPGRFTEARLAGFFRPDAAIAFVFVSDENDICTPFSEGSNRVPDAGLFELFGYYKDCVRPLVSFPAITENSCRDDNGHRDLRDFFHKKWEGIRFKTLVSPATVLANFRKGFGDRPLGIGAIVHTQKNFSLRGNEDSYGGGYMDIVALSGGVAIDMLSPSYEPGLTQIGELMVDKMGLLHDFKLTKSPVDPTTIRVSVDGARVEHRFDEGVNMVAVDQAGRFRSTIDVDYCLKTTPEPSPSPEPSPLPSSEPTPPPMPSPSPSTEPSPEPSPEPSVEPSPVPSPTPTPTPEPTPEPSPTPAPSPSPTPTPSPEPSPTPSPTPSPEPSPSPSPEPTPAPSPTPTPSPEPTPEPSPSPDPTGPVGSPEPTPSPTPSPSPDPIPPGGGCDASTCGGVGI